MYFTGISAVIGSGWLFAPFYTAQQAGPLSIVSWVIGGALIVPVIAVIVLFFYAFHARNFALPHRPVRDYIQAILSGVSTGGVVFSLVGFRAIVELAGEAKEPGKSIPLAIITSIITCVIFCEQLLLAL